MTYYAVVRNDAYLVHHGIKGQKWGVRRFQNEDGTLTDAGIRRYRTIDGNFRTKKANKDVEKLKRELAKAQDKKDYDKIADLKVSINLIGHNISGYETGLILKSEAAGYRSRVLWDAEQEDSAREVKRIYKEFDSATDEGKKKLLYNAESKMHNAKEETDLMEAEHEYDRLKKYSESDSETRKKILGEINADVDFYHDEVEYYFKKAIENDKVANRVLAKYEDSKVVTDIGNNSRIERMVNHIVYSNKVYNASKHGITRTGVSGQHNEDRMLIDYYKNGLNAKNNRDRKKWNDLADNYSAFDTSYLKNLYLDDLTKRAHW